VRPALGAEASERAPRVIALATHDGKTEPTADDRLLVAALSRRAGIRAEAVSWDSPAADWGRYDAVLIRSTWDYHLRPAAFLAWADRVEASGTTLWNPASVVRWNADKRYLRRLDRAGVPVVPTEWISRGTQEADLGGLLRARGWQRAVVKPSVAASAYRAWVAEVDASEISQAPLAALLAEADALVQPFLPEVQQEGEWSFVFFADDEGRPSFSHAVVKRPAQGDFRVQTELGGTVAAAGVTAAVLQQVEEVASVLARLAPGPLLYARIDGVVSGGFHAPPGAFLLMEAELIEPVLFLGHAEHAADRFADALACRIPSRGAPPYTTRQAAPRFRPGT